MGLLGEDNVGSVLLLDHIQEHRIDGHAAPNSGPKTVGPPQDASRAVDFNRGIEPHLPLGDVGQEPPGVVRQQLHPVEPGRHPHELARARPLGAGGELGCAEESAVVEDGNGGGAVGDGGGVGVGDVNGEGELGVQEGEVEGEGGEADGYQLEARVPRFNR